MKHKDGNFLTVNRYQLMRLRSLFSQRLISASSQVLYFCLVELEHRYTATNKRTFTRSLRTLEFDCGLSKHSIIKAVKELSSHNFIKITKEKVFYGKKLFSSFNVLTFELIELTGVKIAPVPVYATGEENRPVLVQKMHHEYKR